jgi:hypothetical protein
MYRVPLRARSAAAALSVWLAACASAPFQTPGEPSPSASGAALAANGPTTRGAAAADAAQACAALADALDAAVSRAGVRDAQDARIAGAHWLRVDRFEASLAGDTTDATRTALWLERLRARDAAARRVEIANLPPDSLRPLSALPAASTPALPPGDAPPGAPADGADSARAALAAGVDRCGRAFVARLGEDPAALAAIRAGARVPDDYVDWLRVLGLYPLTALPFAAGVRREEAASIAAFAAGAADVARDAHRVGPAPDPVGGQRVEGPLPRDALGVPRLDARLRAALLAAHAPVFALAGSGPDDRFGELALGPAGRARVDGSQPAVYGRVAFTRWQGTVRVQLVYTAWFPRRPPAGALDPLAGHLDGVLLRLTLDDSGGVAMVDSIHACGCWHLFVPVGALRERPSPAGLDEWAFVPQRLDSVPPGARLRVRIAARTHAVEGIDTVGTPAAAPDAVYRLLDDDALRSLPNPAGGRRSLYDPRGRVPGTERAERWLFWPMGIADAGSMRQWGRHATAFVGRRHFDEPDLLERRFAPSRDARAAAGAKDAAD